MKKRHLIILLLAFALAIAAERFLLGALADGAPWWMHAPGFFALFGFFICLALAFFSKALGKYWLQRAERYYGRGRHANE